MTAAEVLPELLPCPFCGSESVRIIGGPGSVGGPKHWAGCDYCPARTWGTTGAAAIAAWNTRAQSTPAPVGLSAGELEALVECYCEAVHEYLGGLSQLQWDMQRADTETATRTVARIGIAAALESLAGGMALVPREPTEEVLIAMSQAFGCAPLGDGSDGGYPIWGDSSAAMMCYRIVVPAAPPAKG